MPGLDARGRCQVTTCECGGFISAGFFSEPTTSAEQCLCTHQWWQHLMLVPNIFSNNRWGNPQVACGGFYPRNDGEAWSPGSICICSKTWLSHNSISTVARADDTPPIRSVNHIPSNPPARSQRGPSLPNSRRSPTWSRPPISAFSLPANSNSGDSNSRRNASMQRNSTNFHSGPNTDRGRVQRRVQRQAPSTRQMSATPATEFLALFLPFKISSNSSEIPLYQFSLDQIAVVLTTLETHRLTCSLFLRDEVDTWKNVNEQIAAHLSSAGLISTQSNAQPPSSSSSMASSSSSSTAPSSSSSTGYFSSPMVLICPRNALEWGRRGFKNAGLAANTFTLSALLRISNRVTNPQDNDRRPLLFFAPRFDNLKGPIPQDTIPHPCFPWHVWKSLQEELPTRKNKEAICIQGCPGYGEHSLPVETSALTGRQRLVEGTSVSSLSTSTTSSLDSHGIGQQLSDIIMSSNASPSSQNGLPPAGTSFRAHTLSPPENILPEISPIVRASFHTVTRWQEDVFACAMNHSNNGLKVVGPTPETIATTLLDMLKFHYTVANDEEVEFFEPLPGVTCELQPLSSFIYQFHNFELRSDSPTRTAIGNGPCRAVMRAGVQTLVDSGLFALQGDFYRPMLLPLSSSPRQVSFWVAGFWCALHVLLLGIIPDPITPWMFFVTAYGKDGLPQDLEYIHALDPISANELEPWFKFRAVDTLPPHEHTHPIRQLLINHLNIHDLSIVTTARSQVFHDSITQALIATVLLGASDPWELSEFRAFQAGFNLELGDQTLFDKLHLFDQPNFCRELLAAMSNRRITCIKDLTRRLKFVTSTPLLQSELYDVVREVFQFRLLRWLHGKGHPSKLRGTHVPEDVFDVERSDPLIRARLLLRAVAESDLLPLDPSFSITFALNIPTIADVSFTNQASPPVLDIHTCEARANVMINEWLQAALREDCSLHDEKCTKFDVWIHTQMILSGYNRA